MARTPEFPAQARGEAGGRGLRFPKPPAHPPALAGCPRTLPPSRCSGSRGDTEAGSWRGSCILGGRGEDEVQGPCHCGAEHQHGLGEPWPNPPSALCPHAPLGTERRGEQEGDTYILSDDCESEPEAGLVAPPQQPHGGMGGCRASAGRSGKPKLGLLKGTYRKTMRQIRCRLYKGHKHQRAGRQPVFRGSTEQILGPGPTRCPLAQRHEHSTVPTAPGPGARDQAPACHDWAWGIH